jgi:hypothetical protein
MRRIVLFLYSDLRTRAVTLLEACNKSISIETCCARAMSTTTMLRTPLINLENAIIDAATSGLAEGVLYLCTFNIEGR